MLRGLSLLLLLWAAPSRAQIPLPAQDTTAARNEQAAEPRFPPAFEVVARSAEAAEAAGRGEREVARLADLRSLAQRVESARERQRELRDEFGEVEAEGYVRPERVARLQNQAIAFSTRLENTAGDVARRLSELGQLRSEWVEQRAFWMEWRDSLRGDPAFALLDPEIRQALRHADRVLQRIATAAPQVLALQRSVERLARGNQEIIEQTTQIRALQREALFVPEEPPLYSASFWKGFGERVPERIRAGLRDTEPITGEFLRRAAGLLIVHALLTLLVAVFIPRIRRLAPAGEGWTNALRHPWAIGLFVATAALTSRYVPQPELWELVLWAVMGVSGSLLARAVFRDPRKQLVVPAVTAFYLLFLVFEAIGLPKPLFRVWLAAMGLAGAVFLFALAYRGSGAAGTKKGFTLALYAGALLSLAVLVAEIFGLNNGARWGVQSAVLSAFAVLVVALVVILVRGVIQTLLRSEPEGKLRFLRRIAYQLADRLSWLLQAVLILAAGLYILDVWELAPSPLRTWGALTGAGFTLGETEITIGRVLLAALTLYFAWLASWLFRAFLQGEASGRWQLDAGVANSISKLLQYSLVVIGVFVALGTLGFQLQNFAIIAGALGVGIGFGLQNIVNNFVSGLILLFERPVRVGDTIVLDGEWGMIKKIGLRSTTVVTFDQSEVIVPNGNLVSEKVTNWTLSSSVTRLVFPIGVAYGSELEKVFEILRTVAEEHPLVLQDPPPQVLFTAFGESSLDFELRVWVRGITHRPELRSALLTVIDRRFRDAGIEIPFPQRDLHLRSVDPGVLRQARDGQTEA